MKIDIGKNDKEIGLMSLRDNLIVLHNGERYTIEEYIDKLQNNWNELKKWLGTRINTDKDYERNSHIKEKLQVEDYVIKQVMFFMQELEMI